MTRQGLPTGQMEQETQELLDEYDENLYEILLTKCQLPLNCTINEWRLL